MPSLNEIAVRRFYEALETGETALVDAACATDWEAVPAMRTGPGSDGWKMSIKHLRGVFADIAVTIEQVVESGDMVAVRSTTRAVHVGEMLGVEGTGRPVEYRASDMHQLVDGRIVRTWHLEDFFGLALQLGLEFTRAPQR